MELIFHSPNMECSKWIYVGIDNYSSSPGDNAQVLNAVDTVTCQSLVVLVLVLVVNCQYI